MTILQSEQVNEVAAALAKAQGQIANATLNRINPHFKSKYADLASILDAIRKPLSENGLAPVQQIEVAEKGMLLRTTLLHSSGQWVATEYPLPMLGRPQEMGSLLTYARRYSLTALICTAADDDDDANAAESQGQRVGGQRRPKPPAPNPMQELPPHDAETGEIVADAPITGGAATMAAPPPDHPSERVEGGAVSLEDEARAAARRGRPVFSTLWRRLSAEQRAKLQPLQDELGRLMLAAADAGEGEV